MYKIIQNDKVIDVVQYPKFVRFLPTGHVAMTDRSSAQGIVGSDNKTLYSFTHGVHINAEVATIKEITLEEFNSLRGLLNSGQEPIANVDALVAAKNGAIKHLSIVCKDKITAGFSISLSDNKTYDFKLTAEDQLNLLALENQLNTDTEHFLYHATGQPCRFFSRDDMVKVIAAFRSHVQYHTTYFNVAKQYINSQTSIENVNKFTYGTNIASLATDPVIKQILKNGGNIA